MTSINQSVAIEPNGTSINKSVAIEPNGTSINRSVAIEPHGTSINKSVAIEPNGTSINRSVAIEPHGTSINKSVAIEPNGTSINKNVAIETNGTSVNTSNAIQSNVKNISVEYSTKAPNIRSPQPSLANISDNAATKASMTIEPIKMCVENVTLEINMKNLRLDWIRVLGVTERPTHYTISNSTNYTEGIEYSKKDKVTIVCLEY